MSLELKRGFAGKTMRSGKIQGDSIVNNLTVVIEKISPASMAGSGAHTDQPIGDTAHIRARQPDNTDSPASRRSRNSDNGIGTGEAV